MWSQVAWQGHTEKNHSQEAISEVLQDIEHTSLTTRKVVNRSQQMREPWKLIRRSDSTFDAENVKNIPAL